MISSLHSMSPKWIDMSPQVNKQEAGSTVGASHDKGGGSALPAAQADILSPPSSKSDRTKPTGLQLTPEQLDQVDKLKARDREVRTHEQAHLSAAGSYATSGASFTYQQGPDGRAYAIGGEVGIDIAAIPNDPEATRRKMDVVQRAALAPAEPSDQDLKVAQAASQKRIQAEAEIAQANSETNDATSGKPSLAASDQKHDSDVQAPSSVSEGKGKTVEPSEDNVKVSSVLPGFRAQVALNRYQQAQASFAGQTIGISGFA